MRLLHLVSLPAFLATGALVSALHSVPADSPEWNPATGQTHRTELITKHFLTTESMVFVKGGQETISLRTFNLRVTQTLRTSDQLLETGGGRPLKFRRYYDEVRLSVVSETSGGGKLTRDRRMEARGGADGSSVVFTWIPKMRCTDATSTAARESRRACQPSARTWGYAACSRRNRSR